jgi:hypothetical protein
VKGDLAGGITDVPGSSGPSPRSLGDMGPYSITTQPPVEWPISRPVAPPGAARHNIDLVRIGVAYPIFNCLLLCGCVGPCSGHWP